MTKRNGNGHGKGGVLKLYRSYMFRGKNPSIDLLRTKIQDTTRGKLDNKVLHRIREEGGPTVGCMRGWFFGDVKRPRDDTIEAAGRALGFKRIWIKHND